MTNLLRIDFGWDWSTLLMTSRVDQCESFLFVNIEFNAKVSIVFICESTFGETDRHIKLFPQRDEHLFFSVPGVRDH